MSDLTLSQKKALAFCPKPGAILSFLSASFILIDILSSPTKKRKSVYHRIMFAMCCNSMLQSCLYFWGTWAFPQYTSPQAYNPIGSISSCTIQGCLFQFGFTVPFYYASLSYYSYRAVQCKFASDVLQKLELWIHVGVYIFPITSAFILLLNQSFNAGSFICWLAVYPYGCDNNATTIECTRGPKDGNRFSILFWIFAGFPIFFFLFFATIMMIRLYYHIRQMEYNKQQYRGKKFVQEQARYEKSNLVLRQALLYLVAFYMTYIVAVISALVDAILGSDYIPLTIAVSCIVPCQGIFILIVYIRLQASNIKQQSTYQQQIPETSATMIARSIELRQQQQLKSQSISSKESTFQRIKRRSKSIFNSLSNSSNNEFSIFDGTNPSDQWREFFLDDDEDEEFFQDEDHNEQKKEEKEKEEEDDDPSIDYFNDEQ